MSSQTADPLEQFLIQRMQNCNISSTTLLITFFCDVVTQHGGEIWLGSIIHAMAPLGINERLTRTAVFRLVQDGWLESRKQGRRSYYRLSETGEHYYQRSAKRIYAASNPKWDGDWTLLFVSLVAEEKRDALHKGLSWLGYGRIASAVYALPRDDHTALDELLADLELEDSIVKMRAQADSAENLQKLVLTRWKLDDLRRRYKDFTAHYREAGELLKQVKTANGHSLFLFRILMLHEYRRILLSDPELPTAMLPDDWEGYVAQALASELYRTLAPTTAKWINCELLNSDGVLKGGVNVLKTRFFEQQSLIRQPN
jgi:phenylacetic acid degradation operon negative regulatory protein